MKLRFFLSLAGALLLMGLVSPVSSRSQDYQVVSSTFENDSMDAQIQVSLFREFVKNNNFQLALTPWRIAFIKYPSAARNIYIDGVKILSYFIEKEKDEARKSEWVDTLMLLYDQRIKYFGQEGFVLGRKGVDLLKFRKKDFMKAYEFLAKSVEIQKNEAEGAVLVTLMQTTVSAYKADQLSAGIVVSNYMGISEILTQQLQSETDEKKQEGIRQNQEYIEKMFFSSGAATCENLVSIFRPQFEKSPEDPALLTRISRQLPDSKCQENPLFLQASENLYRLEPSSESAYALARLQITARKFQKALEYYQEAIRLEKDAHKIARYYYEMAVVSNSELKLSESARNLLVKALEMDPEMGRAYLLMGNLYAASAKSCGSNDFETAAVYWLAVDKLLKAKSIDPGLSAEADEQIARYKAWFPQRENAFFYSVNDGDSVRIGCWIQETTKARFIR